MTQSEQGQIHFTGESSCKEFIPNQFRRNFCITCQGKIQQHYSAKPEHIAAALEYSVDKGIYLVIFNRILLSLNYAYNYNNFNFNLII